jgi:hypothetical protein
MRRVASGGSLRETIAHEGTHVKDDINFLTSYDFNSGNMTRLQMSLTDKRSSMRFKPEQVSTESTASDQMTSKEYRTS